MTEKQQFIFDLASGGLVLLLLRYLDHWLNRRKRKRTERKAGSRNNAAVWKKPNTPDQNRTGATGCPR